MNVQPLTADEHERWNEFCIESGDAWFRHTSHFLEYIQAYDPKVDTKSVSFMLTHNGEIKAIMPLLIEREGEIAELSFSDSYGPGAALANEFSWKRRKKALKEIFAEVDQIADQNNVVRARLQIPAICRRCVNGNISFNYLNKFGFIDSSVNTRIVDLEKSLDQLRADMRKGHRHSIRDADEILEGIVYHSENIDPKSFERYKHCHINDAGEQTRPDETFEQMRTWIEDENAFLVGAHRGGEFGGFSLFTAFDNGVSYTSSARNPESDLYETSVGHYIQWVAMKWMKEQGYDAYDLGIQHFTSIPPEMATEKEQNISYFKRGFGGTTQTFYRGEKYYDPEFYQQVAQTRMEEYSDTLDPVS
jgi:hypothetical protein